MNQHELAHGETSTAPGGRLEFIIIQTPDDTTKDTFRRQVRSHVTRVQHQRTRLSAITGVDHTKSEVHSDKHRIRRKKTDGQAKFRANRVEKITQAVKRPTPTGQDAVHTPPRASTDLLQVTKNTSPATAKAITDELARRAGTSVGDLRHGASGISALAVHETPGEIVTTPAVDSEQPALPGSPAAVNFSQGVMAARTFLFHDQDNVVGIVLKHLRFDLSSVLATYKVIVQMQSQDFERNQPDMPAMKPGSTWLRFWEYIWTDPAIMIGAVLLTVTFRLQMWEKPPDHPHWYHLLHLRGFFIRTIDAAFRDPVRCTCDQMLVAVALASAFEVKYNQNMDQGYHTHMRGLVKMVRMRGGLAQIATTDPFLERFLLWHVANTSALPRGQNVYYQQLSRTTAVIHPKADSHMFQMKELVVRAVQ
ncbi:hypothetical protein CLAFUR4_07376 [Fulvia fulva]|nr:hypothetical protein CLAFUR4_07376 [Fulvia fulva]KAK4622495.1 hypothetical protein CLAFUR0_07374 [Fulvia fulva]